jgi:hypothetical protein
MEQFRMATALLILLGSSVILAQRVRLRVGFHLHYSSALSEHFLPKELSQIFAPIPGAPHGTLWNGRRSLKNSRIIKTYGAGCKSVW